MSCSSEVGHRRNGKEFRAGARPKNGGIAMDAVIITEEVVEDEFNVVICQKCY